MKQILFLLVAFLVSFFGVVKADVSIEGYHRKDGTYVPPHHRSDPNSTILDNWSVKPNINPHTRKPGHRSP